MKLTMIGERLEDAAALDRLADPAHEIVTRLMPSGARKDVLHGVWLGHPLHPALSDLPIGFWTSAFCLDIVPGRNTRRAADLLVGMGVVAALPTAAAGVADWSDLNTPERRTGLVHAAANITATALYALSFVARKRGHRTRGIALSIAGATAATAGAFLGGHLTFRRAAGVNRAATAPAPSDWTTTTIESDLNSQNPTLGSLEGEPITAIGGDVPPSALFARCTHLGGPLQDGELVDGCVRCPWHGSTFDMTDGTVVRGPATSPQPAYELRVVGDRLDARRRRP